MPRHGNVPKNKGKGKCYLWLAENLNYTGGDCLTWPFSTHPTGEAVCHWAFELAAARPDDELADLFPGTGAVSKAWATWQGKFTLPAFALTAAE